MTRLVVAVIVVAAVVACPNFDQLEADALEAGARLRDGGSRPGGGSSTGAAGGSSGGAAGGSSGGVVLGLTLTPIFKRTRPVVQLASTEGRLFVGMLGSSGVTVEAVLPNQGGVISRSFTDTELGDLDARHGEAVACSGREAAVFSGNAWLDLDAGISLGRCLSTTVYRNGGPTQISVWWKVSSGEVAALPVSAGRTTIASPVLVGARFDRLVVRPFGTSATFFSGADSSTRVGSVTAAFMLSQRQNPPLSAPRLAASESQRLIAAVSSNGLLVWEPSTQSAEALEAPLVRVSNMGGIGFSVRALALSDDGVAFVGESMAGPDLSVPFDWVADGGSGSFSAAGAFVVLVSAGQFRVKPLDGSTPPYALAFDEAEKKLYLAQGIDGGSQVVLVAP